MAGAEELVKIVTEKMVPYQGDLRMLDFSEKNIFSEHMAKLVSWHRDYTRFWKQSMLFCDARWPDFLNPYAPGRIGSTGIAEPLFLKAVTRKDVSFLDGIKLGRKIWNLDHAIWTLQGRHRDMVEFADIIYKQPPSWGVDVPNATHMIIENADRLGLAQLHQLRGRVGRGQLESHCYLLFNSGVSEAAKVRLTAMRDSQDGFYLAEQDLKLRGPGDLLGTRQAGEQSFRIAALGVHAHLMPEVIRRGEALLQAAAGSQDASQMQHLLEAWAPADGGHLSA